MSTAVTRHDPVALARAEDERHWTQLQRQANVLARTKLVPRECQGNPDATMAALLTLDAYGLAPNAVLIKQLHFIDGTPEPSAQLLAGLLSRAGYDIDWTELTPTRAAARIRRLADTLGAPHGPWTTEIAWTIDQARTAGLLDQWVEHRTQDGTWPDGNKKWKVEKFVLDRPGVDEPDWVAGEKRAGRVKRNENWWRFPDDMLASKVIRRLVKRFAAHVALGVDPDTVVMSSPVGLAASANAAAAGEDPAGHDDDVVDAEIVDERQASATGAADGDLVDADWTRRFAIRIREHAGVLGVDPDQLRHAIVHTATQGRVESARQVLASEAGAVTAWTAALLDGNARMADRPGGGYQLVEHDPKAQP